MVTASSSSHRTTVGRAMEVLLVEDNLEDARTAIGSLKASSIPCRVTLVLDGEEALRFLRRDGEFRRAPRPDLILLDIELPKRDGREVLTEIRTDDALKAIPVVVLTASRTHQAVFAAQKLHVDEYMTKPVSQEQFLRVVKALHRCWLEEEIILPPLEEATASPG